MFEEHLGYVSDLVRLKQFRAALAKTIRPGNCVVDLGCGSGILGLLSLQAGAGRVYAIESSGVIEVARETFKRAGRDQQASFIHGKSQQVELPERADVVICDHVGYFGFDYGIIRFMDDARRRFLKPGGTLIPSRIVLRLAAVESETGHRQAEGWSAEAVPQEFRWLRTHSVNTKHAVKYSRNDLLGAAVVLGDIDLQSDQPDYLSWAVELRVERDGVLHGLGGWFECELADGVWMTNSPLAEEAIQRSQVFLPVDKPVAVNAGDAIRATIMARPEDQLIAWTVELPASGQRFSQSTWQAGLFAPEHLVRTKPGHVPQLSAAGRAHLTVLGYCDGTRTAQEIERAVLHDHPDLFPNREEIAGFVAQVLGRDTD